MFEFINILILKAFSPRPRPSQARADPGRVLDISHLLSRLIILIFLICLYGWLTYDFYDANGFTLRDTTDLFCMATGAFILQCSLIIQNIYKQINKAKFNNN